MLDVERLQVCKNDRTGLVGRNGSGKTTLLELLAGVHIPEEGTITRTGSVELLPQLKRTDTHKSGGEVTQEYINAALGRRSDLLLADEPTNFLDLESVEALESLLKDYEGTIIFVSHDRRFIEKVGTRIVMFENEGIHVFEGTYDEYKNYEPQEQRDLEEDKRMLLETRITEVLSRLSIAPSDELEKEF